MTPLVLLHGWALNRRVFDDLVMRLDRPCLALDLPGHGTAEPLADWQPDLLARHMLEQMPDKFSLLGWSLGAQIATQIAALAPQRIEKLALICATPRFLRADDWPHGAQAETLELLLSHLMRNPSRTISDFLALQVRGSAAAAATLAQLQQAIRAGGSGTAASLQQGLEWLKTVDQRFLLASIDTPTLVLAGQHDRVVHPEASKALTAALPNALYLEIPRCGHAPFVSHPEDTGALLKEFLI